MPPITPTSATLLMTIAPVLVALAAISVLSFPPEPTRQRFSAIFVAGAGAAYLGAGFGPLELLFCGVVTLLAYRGLSDYRAIGLAWVLHSCWDAAHDLWGAPILPFAPTSSYGCFVSDFWLAAWYFAGAPSPWRRETWQKKLSEFTATLQGCTLVALVCIAIPAQLLFNLEGAIAAALVSHIVAVAVHTYAMRNRPTRDNWILGALVPFAIFLRGSVSDTSSPNGPD